jgi:hypothetical protein
MTEENVNFEVWSQIDSSCWQNAKKQISETTEKFKTAWMKEQRNTFKEVPGRIRSEWVNK